MSADRGQTQALLAVVNSSATGSSGMLQRVDNREAVWRAALALAQSNSVLDRADAAQCLAPFVGNEEVDSRLIGLAGDPADTYVTETTIEALVRRRDPMSWQVIAHAYGVEPDGHTRAHMTDAIEEALGWDSSSLSEARSTLMDVARKGPHQVRAGAADLIQHLDSVRRLERPRTLRDRWARIFRR